jgi:hypothetical protein
MGEDVGRRINIWTSRAKWRSSLEYFASGVTVPHVFVSGVIGRNGEESTLQQ